MVAVPLIHGRLTAADYEDDVAADPRIDKLRDKMECVEDKQFSADYLDPAKRSIANAITVEFKDGSKTREVVVEYPIGHRRRRKEGIPLLVEKFRTNLARRFPAKQQQAILDVAPRREGARGDARPRIRRPDGHLIARAPRNHHENCPRYRVRWLPAQCLRRRSFPSSRPGCGR